MVISGEHYIRALEVCIVADNTSAEEEGVIQ